MSQPLEMEMETQQTSDGHPRSQSSHIPAANRHLKYNVPILKVVFELKSTLII